MTYLRHGDFVRKRMSDGRWIYGYAFECNPGGILRVNVLKDQAWELAHRREGPPAWNNPWISHEDYDLKGWEKVPSEDPMQLREAVIEAFEKSAIYVNATNTVEDEATDVDELYVKDHDRTRLFMQVYDLITEFQRRYNAPKLSATHLVIKPTVIEKKIE